MAPLPKRRHSSRRQAKRTRGLKLFSVTLSKCPKCQEMRVPHEVCKSCGY
ncbi:MAG: 50S ribosomal protein L32, partial [Patescibacteria group bacterium]